MSRILTPFVIVMMMAMMLSLASAAVSTPALVNTTKVAGKSGSTTTNQGPVMTSLNFTEYFSFSTYYDQNKQSTSLIESFPLENFNGQFGTIWNLVDAQNFEEPIITQYLQKPYDAFPRGWIFTAHDLGSRATNSMRWASFKGLSWIKYRGHIAGEAGSTILADPTNDYAWITFAAPDGHSESLNFFKGDSPNSTWSTSVPILSNTLPYTSWAQDVTFLDPQDGRAVVAMISQGLIHVFDALNGTLLVKSANPCGFPAADIGSLHMSVVSPAVGVNFLVIYGGLSSSEFGVCVTTATADLKKIWSKTLTGSLGLVAGRKSFTMIDMVVPKTASANASVVPVLFFNLAINPEKTTTFTNVEMLKLEDGTVLSTISSRAAPDQNNMPIPLFNKGGLIENVLISVNGNLQAVNPAAGNSVITCQNTACANTPSVLVRDAETTRIVCASASDVTKAIAVDIKVSSQSCNVVWEQTIPAKVVSSPVQPSFAVMYATKDPYVVFPDQAGNVWSMTFRAVNEPAPTDAPTPSPSPGPKTHLVTALNSNLHNPVLNTIPQIAQFNDGPVVAGTCLAEITYKNKTSRMSVPFFQAVRFSSSSSPAEKYLFYDEKVLFNQAVISSINAAASELAVDYAAFTGITLVSDPENFAELPRFAATQVATNGQGYTYYSVASVDNVERLNAFYQTGGGAKGEYKFMSKFATPVTVDNFTTHIGQPTFVNGLVFFSFFDSLYAINGQTGSAVIQQKNPCGIFPAQNSVFKYDFMSVYDIAAKPGSSPLALVTIIPEGAPAGTFGLCAYQSTSGNAKESWKGQVADVTSIVGVTSLPHQNIFIMDIYKDNSTSYLKGFDIQSGAEVFNIQRLPISGTAIAAVPNTLNFLANMQVGQYTFLSMISATSGKVIHSCDTAFSLFTLVEDPASAGSYYIVGSLLFKPNVMAAIKFDATATNDAGLCTVVWLQDVVYDVSAVSQTLMQSSDKSTSLISAVTLDGTVHSLSLSAAAPGETTKVVHQQSNKDIDFRGFKKSAELLSHLKN